MSDLISRQNAIKGVKELFACADIGNDEYDITYMLENLPSTDRPTGEWIKALDGCERHVKCTHCFKTYDWHSEAKHYNYCPNCGAMMRGEEE